MDQHSHAQLITSRGDLLVACARCHALLPVDKLFRQNGKPVCLECLSSLELQVVMSDWVDQHGQP
jgi:formylmethanofuran dehydrogenase subunit E